MPALENPLGIMWGFRSIGAFIGTSERHAEYLATSGRLPAAKVGGRWCSSEKALAEYLEGKLRACLPQGEAK